MDAEIPESGSQDLLSKLDPKVGLIHIKPLYSVTGAPSKGEKPLPIHVIGALLGDHEAISILSCLARTPREREVWDKMYDHSRKRIEVLCGVFERKGFKDAAKFLKDRYEGMYVSVVPDPSLTKK